MIAVVQRVIDASVMVGDEVVGRIGRGMAVLLAVHETDGPAEVDARQNAQDLCSGKGTETHQKSVILLRKSTAHRRARAAAPSITREFTSRFAQGPDGGVGRQLGIVRRRAYREATFAGDLLRERIGRKP